MAKKCKFWKIFLLICVIVLCGCIKQPIASNTIAESANNALVALEQNLPATCATDGVKAQITAIKTQINAITTACDAEKQVITQEKIRWKWAFLGLLIIIVAYVGKRISDNLK